MTNPDETTTDEPTPLAQATRNAKRILIGRTLPIAAASDGRVMGHLEFVEVRPNDPSALWRMLEILYVDPERPPRYIRIGNRDVAELESAIREFRNRTRDQSCARPASRPRPGRVTP